MLSTLDSLKREDFAIGVIAVALGVGVAQVSSQVRPSDKPAPLGDSCESAQCMHLSSKQGKGRLAI